MAFEQKFGEVRSWVQQAPSRLAFLRLQRMLGPMFLEDRERTAAQVLPYVREHLAPWPGETRHLELSDATDPALMPRDPRQFSLVRHLRIQSAGAFDRKGRRLTHRFLSALEGGEMGTLCLDTLDITGGGDRALWQGLMCAPSLERVKTLRLEDVSGALLRLVRAPWAQTVETLKIGDRHISEKACSELRRHMPGLRGLEAWTSGLGDQAWPGLTHVKLHLGMGRDLGRLRRLGALQPGLERVSVWANATIFEVLDALGEEVVRGLSWLTFGTSWTSGDGVSRERRAEICTWLEGLTALELWGSALDVFQGTRAMELFELTPPHLTELFLGVFEDRHVHQILSKISPGSLRSLHLMTNTAPTSVLGLPSCAKLDLLSFSPSGERGLRWLDEALPELSVLELRLGMCVLGVDDVAETTLLDRLSVLYLKGVSVPEETYRVWLRRMEAGRMERFSSHGGELSWGGLIHSSIPYIHVEEFVPF